MPKTPLDSSVIQTKSVPIPASSHQDSSDSSVSPSTSLIESERSPSNHSEVISIDGHEAPSVPRLDGVGSEEEAKNRANSPSLSRSQKQFRNLSFHEMKVVHPAVLASRLRNSGLEIVEMEKDGNCMFRSVADQVYADSGMHDVVRKQCMDYMESNKEHFKSFTAEPVDEYISRKRQSGVFGNHLELQAISELYQRPIYIYTTDDKPMNIFQNHYETDNEPLRLSYHYGNHYNSVRDPLNPSCGVGLGLPGLLTKRSEMNVVLQESDRAHVSDDIVRATQRESEALELEESLIERMKEKSLEEFERHHLQPERLEVDVMEMEDSFLEAAILASLNEF